MGQFWPPKLAQTHPKRGVRAAGQAPAGLSVPLHGHNPLGQCVGCPFVVFVPVCPEMVSVGPIWACAGPDCVPRPETENWLYLGLDRPNRDSDGTFSLCQPPLSGGFHTPEWLKRTAPLDVVFVRRVPV